MLYSLLFGALAQLGARHTGSVEVTGSNPVCSIYYEEPQIRDFIGKSMICGILAVLFPSDNTFVEYLDKRASYSPIISSPSGNSRMTSAQVFVSLTLSFMGYSALPLISPSSTAHP